MGVRQFELHFLSFVLTTRAVIVCCQAITVDESMNQRPTVRKTIQLTDCLELFTTMEKLGEQDPWYVTSFVYLMPASERLQHPAVI